MIINIGDDILRLRSLKLLKKSLVDKTTIKFCSPPMVISILHAAISHE